jgi:hypothetical protein
VHIIERLESVLKELQNNINITSEIPAQLTDTDEKMNNIICSFINTSRAEQDQIRNHVKIDIAWLLLGYGMRMATYAMRLCNQKYFANGLIALSMTFGVLDSREILVLLSLYYDVHKNRYLSFDELSCFNEDFTLFLKKFLERDEKDKSIECMGYVLAKDKNKNLIYHRTW